MSTMEELERRVAALEARVHEEAELRAAVDRDQADHGAKIRATHRLTQALSITQSEHTDTLERISTKLDDLSGQIRELRHQVMETADRVSNVEARLDRLESRFEALETRFEALETRFEALETRFEALETRFDTVEELLHRVVAKLDA